MKDSGNSKDGSSRNNLAWALVALSGASGLVLGTDAEAQGRTSTPVKRTVVDAPKTAQIKLPAKWQRVSITLTKDQRNQLARLGVNTTKLDITTYDISKLSGQVVN